MKEQTSQKPFRLGLVGFGALSENNYVRAIAELPHISIGAVAELYPNRQERAQELCPDATIFEDYRQLAEASLDAVAIILPNFLHLQATQFFLEKGLPVLLEKPLTATLEEAQTLESCVQATQTFLQVGMVRRYYAKALWLRQTIEQQLLGAPLSFDFQEGHVFKWPVKSDYLVNKKKAGGGVLVDIGVHVLDLLQYWLGPVARIENSWDDEQGGTESEVLLQLQLKNGTKGRVGLSRLRNLSNTSTFEFERGRIVTSPLPQEPLFLWLKGQDQPARIELESGPLNLQQAFQTQLSDFVNRLSKGQEPAVDTKSGRHMMELLTQHYARRQLLPCTF